MCSLIEIAWLGGDGRTIRSHAVFNKGLIDELDTLRIGCIVRRNREINTHGPVDLNVDKPRSNNLPAEIDNAIGHGKFIVETCLRIDDDASARIDPKIVLKQFSIAGKSAIGEFDQHP